MYKKASSELVVARRRRGSHDRAEDVRVAAADRVQGPLGEDHGDDAVERDDRRVPRARERVVVEAEHLAVTLNNGGAEVLEAAAQDDVEGARVLARRLERFFRVTTSYNHSLHHQERGSEDSSQAPEAYAE